MAILTMLAMPWVTRHLRVGLLLVLLVLFAAIPLEAGATTTPPLTPATTQKLIVTELQTTGTTSSEEFIELYNLTDTDIDLGDTAHAGKEPWKLQFFSASATTSGTPDWTKPTATVSLSGTAPARGYFVLASTGYAPGGIDSDQSYSSRLSDSGGGIQLVTATTTAISSFDRLMWKQVTSGQTLPAGVWQTPAAKGSLQRLPNDDGEYMASDRTLTDFTLAADMTPKDMWHAPVVPEIPETPNVPDTAPPDGDNPAPEVPTTVNNIGLDAPQVTELMPNPASPLTDTDDEFIELYNPNSEPFNLANYTLEVGVGTLHDFTFADGTILTPQSYTAFYSRDTRLSLSNSGGQARLLDKSGAKVSETAPYDTADDGASWSWDDIANTWQWSLSSTPNMINTFTAPAATVKAVSSTTSAAAKKTTIKTTAAKTAAKVKGTTSTKAAKAKTPKKKTVKSSAAKTAAVTTQAPEKAPIHTGVLVAVVASAVLYAGYEYRQDIRNRFHKLRHNRAVRAFARQ